MVRRMSTQKCNFSKFFFRAFFQIETAEAAAEAAAESDRAKAAEGKARERRRAAAAAVAMSGCFRVAAEAAESGLLSPMAGYFPERRHCPPHADAGVVHSLHEPKIPNSKFQTQNSKPNLKFQIQNKFWNPKFEIPHSPVV